eukprot:3938619-Rhodomonas_salina.2
MQAAARLAQRHSNPARDAKPAAAAAAAQQKQASVLGGKESVDAARKRVALLRKELKQVPLPSFLSPVLQSSVRSLSLSADAQHAVLFVRATRVEKLEQQLAHAKASMHDTEHKVRRIPIPIPETESRIADRMCDSSR